MRFFTAFIATIAITLTACAGQSPPETGGEGAVPPVGGASSQEASSPSTEEIAQRLFEAFNQQRVANQLTPLAISPELTRSAQQHSDTMVSGRFLSTRGADEPDAVARITSQGIKTLKLGEDVVRVQTAPDRVVDATMSIWMDAAPDRKNILSSAFTRTGIGVTRAEDGDYYISADFAQ